MDIDYNTKCYNFKKINTDNGLFDKTIDCTYIIHLENNGRLEHIYSEINKVKPTKNIFILFNKGFKKCNKKLIEQVSYQDLSDAFLQCFKHANINNYGNILILEDDFIFNAEINNIEHINNINTFLQKNKDNEFVYHLGLIPIISFPTNDINTYKSIIGLTMHSVIYSKKCIQNINNLELKYKHWDVIIDKNINNKYFYYKPLCYQTFPETENKQSWHEKDNNILFIKFKNSIIQLLNLNNEPEPGFSIIYFFSKIFILLFIFTVFFLLYCLSVFFKKLNVLNTFLKVLHPVRYKN
jgi:hypothetical protein